MPIKKPSSHMFKSVRLKTAKQSLEKKHSAHYDVSLNLTPMIDMFVVLVIFLLMTFSASGEILFIQKNIELPKASKSETLVQSPVIIIGNGKVVAEGKDVGLITDIEEDENFEIADLSEILNNLKRNYQQLHPNQQFSGNVIIQGHRDISFRVLKKVMFTCTSAGYTTINFAVLPSKAPGAPTAPGAPGAAAPAEG
jgi:biopolymer transport protein ExbD